MTRNVSVAVAVGLVVCLVGYAQAANISSVQTGLMATSFDNATQVFAVGGDPLAVVVNLDNSTTSVGVGSLDLDAILSLDWSSGGTARGDFDNGTIDLVMDTASNYYVTGTLSFLRLIETTSTSNILHGSGQFEVTAVNVPLDWVWSSTVGSVASLTFVQDEPINHGGLDDFQKSFDGFSSLTITPDDSGIPEPATLMLLAGGLLFGLAGKRARKH